MKGYKGWHRLWNSTITIRIISHFRKVYDMCNCKLIAWCCFSGKRSWCFFVCSAKQQSHIWWCNDKENKSVVWGKKVSEQTFCNRHKRQWCTNISRVSDQNGVSLLYIMLEIHLSGREPSIILNSTPTLFYIQAKAEQQQ